MKERAGVLLVALGLMQMMGDALHLMPLKALALATAASPAPRVFSTVDGFEAYSTRFAIEWTDRHAATYAVGKPIVDAVLEWVTQVDSRALSPPP